MAIDLLHQTQQATNSKVARNSTELNSTELKCASKYDLGSDVL